MSLVSLVDAYERATVSLIDSIDQDDVKKSYARFLEAQAAYETEVLVGARRHALHLECEKLAEKLAAINKQLATGLAEMQRSHERVWLPLMPGQAQVLHEKVDYGILTQLANRVSRHSKAPVGMSAQHDRVTSTHLPWPTEDVMRRGRLASGRDHASEAHENTGDQNEDDLKRSSAAERPIDQVEAKASSTAIPLDLDLDLYEPSD
ncbi:Mediator of RNA polymerase II transcription subunit 4 [Savitreella phatthalungensis]